MYTWRAADSLKFLLSRCAVLFRRWIDIVEALREVIDHADGIRVACIEHLYQRLPRPPHVLEVLTDEYGLGIVLREAPHFQYGAAAIGHRKVEMLAKDNDPPHFSVQFLGLRLARLFADFWCLAHVTSMLLS
jgi:hypothetical protein